LFQQVTRLKKNANELKESIFKFLWSDKRLQASKIMHSKDSRVPISSYPQTKIKVRNRWLRPENGRNWHGTRNQHQGRQKE
jgi:hypothetical protein